MRWQSSVHSFTRGPERNAHSRIDRILFPIPLTGAVEITCQNCGGGEGSIAIYRAFGEFRRANSYSHLYGAQGQPQA
ncbi:hypothetical protein TNCV_3924861 [Trichonephila clavipes]|nr:hypothetical protein TNCV_3924861 [Trichonephila clavipes]